MDIAIRKQSAKEAYEMLDEVIKCKEITSMICIVEYEGEEKGTVEGDIFVGGFHPEEAISTLAQVIKLFNSLVDASNESKDHVLQ